MEKTIQTQNFLPPENTSANRFIVRCEELNIAEHQFQSIVFKEDSNTLLITIRDHIIKVTDEMICPIVKYLKDNVNTLFNLNVEYLDKTGCTLYGETYKNCKINSIEKMPLDYNVDEAHHIQLKVKYDNVSYYGWFDGKKWQYL